MKTISYKLTAKQRELCGPKEWPVGPWTEEPDKVQWADPATGMPCLAKRNPHLGFWCGYVGVGVKHPLHGKHYDKVPESIDVHGGLTFADACSVAVVEECDQALAICHVAEPDEEDDLWWFGFDCGHLGDVVPYMVDVDFGSLSLLDGTYRDLGYVQRECASLAAQLQALA